jgi:hypothetical protein
MKEIYKKTKLWNNKGIKDVLKICIGYEYDIVLVIWNFHYNKGEKLAVFSLKIEEIDEFIKNLKKAKKVAIKNKRLIENGKTINNLKETYKKTKKWKNEEIESEIIIYVGLWYDIGIIIRTYENKKIYTVSFPYEIEKYTVSFLYEIEEIDEFIENLKKAKKVAIKDRIKESLK